MTAEARLQLVKDLENARRMLNAALSEVDDRREIFPGWTKRHLQAHIAGWDELCITLLQDHLAGKPSPAADAPDTMAYIHAYNDRSIAQREKLTDAEITAEFDRLRQEFIRLIREMPDEKFSQPFDFDWGQKGTVAELTPIFVEHEIDHARDLRKLKTGVPNDRT